MSQAKGVIVLCPQVLCGRCSNWTDLNEAVRTKRGGAAEAHRLGFRLTKDEGWLCPTCVHVDACTGRGGGCLGTTYCCDEGYRLWRRWCNSNAGGFF